MYSEPPYKSMKTVMNNKKRRVGKPWWNEELTELWNVVCDDERKWLKCTAKSDKARFKSEYVTARKHLIVRCKDRSAYIGSIFS